MEAGCDRGRNAGGANTLMRLLTSSGGGVGSLSSEQVGVVGELILDGRLQHGVRRAAVQQGHLTLPDGGSGRGMRA